MRSSFLTLQRGNAVRDALRRKEETACQRGALARWMAETSGLRRP
ncbi:hypothetical protein DND47_28765 [Pseudomonas syringae pv. syringae]|nr:hypothetical protein DND47_28765 [Pseudomonas syringae pv. syringae]